MRCNCTIVKKVAGSRVNSLIISRAAGRPARRFRKNCGMSGGISLSVSNLSAEGSIASLPVEHGIAANF
jgi:hypothetical protein